MFKKILCVVDPDTKMDTAIIQASRVAEDHQAEITFMAVLKAVKPWRFVFQDQQEFAKEFAVVEDNVQSLIKQNVHSLTSVKKPDVIVASGIAFIEVIKQVLSQQYDLVVKCAEDTDWFDRMLGSEDMHLLRKCPSPVLMVKPGYQDGFRRVLATVDVNDELSDSEEGRVQEELNHQVLEYSAALSLPDLSEMHIGSVWEAYAENWLRYGAFAHQSDAKVDKYVDQEYRECTSKLATLVSSMDEVLGPEAVSYVRPRPHLVKGSAALEIPKMVDKHKIDLIVMGTVGRVGIPGLLIGNTAESILEQTTCSILAIKPDGFKTPIE